MEKNGLDKISLNLGEQKQVLAVGKALSSDKRLALLDLLGKEPLNINEIAERMQIPPSSAAMHVKVLEEAGMITTELMPGIRGSMKVCWKCAESVTIDLEMPEDVKHRVEIVSMPIGNYVDYCVEPTCGIVNTTETIGEEDEPRCFYNPNRITAQLLWFGKGYVEYRFPNAGLNEYALKKIEISAEMCSETADYNLNCPSDITLWINGKEVGTWRCPSDFGGRRGKLNPEWWPDKNTQYGNLKTWGIDRKATYLDGEKISGKGVMDYRLNEYPYITVRIGNSERAEYQGGMNLFGNGFGDFPQDIVMKLYY